MPDGFATGSRRTGPIAWLVCRAWTTIFSLDGGGRQDRFRHVVLHPAALIPHIVVVHTLQLQQTFAHNGDGIRAYIKPLTRLQTNTLTVPFRPTGWSLSSRGPPAALSVKCHRHPGVRRWARPMSSIFSRSSRTLYLAPLNYHPTESKRRLRIVNQTAPRHPSDRTSLRDQTRQPLHLRRRTDLLPTRAPHQRSKRSPHQLKARSRWLTRCHCVPDPQDKSHCPPVGEAQGPKTKV